MTEAELLDFLTANVEGEPDPEALTMEEMADKAGISLFTIRRKVKRLCQQGKMECFRDWRTKNSGDRQRYPVYRVVA